MQKNVLFLPDSQATFPSRVKGHEPQTSRRSLRVPGEAGVGCVASVQHSLPGVRGIHDDRAHMVPSSDPPACLCPNAFLSLVLNLFGMNPNHVNAQSMYSFFKNGLFKKEPFFLNCFLESPVSQGEVPLNVRLSKSQIVKQEGDDFRNINAGVLWDGLHRRFFFLYFCDQNSPC